MEEIENDIDLGLEIENVIYPTKDEKNEKIWESGSPSERRQLFLKKCGLEKISELIEREEERYKESEERRKDRSWGDRTQSIFVKEENMDIIYRPNHEEVTLRKDVNFKAYLPGEKWCFAGTVETEDWKDNKPSKEYKDKIKFQVSDFIYTEGLVPQSVQTGKIFRQQRYLKEMPNKIDFQTNELRIPNFSSFNDPVLGDITKCVVKFGKRFENPSVSSVDPSETRLFSELIKWKIQDNQFKKKAKIPPLKWF